MKDQTINNLLIVLLVVASMFLCFGLGIEYETNNKSWVITIATGPVTYAPIPAETITVEQGLEYITEARFTHQYIVNKINEGRMFKASEEYKALEHEEKWVNRYDQLWNLILELNRSK